MKRKTLAFSDIGLLSPDKDPYPMTLPQIKEFFGLETHSRRNVFDGVKKGVGNMFDAGVQRIILGGSFISLKEHPQDADIAWWYNESIDWDILDAVFQSGDMRPARGKFLIDHKIDGIEEVGYTYSHEYFLRSNNRVAGEYREIGIVQIVTEKIFDYDKATEEPGS